MDFDDIVVKESPGLCRCCLSEGCYKDLSTEYSWMNETEIYADLLLECFDISISQHMEGPNGLNRLICEVCITRLRDACNFKKQVLDSEKKFVDMVGRGEFRPKVVIYQQEMKAENLEGVDDSAIDFLDDDVLYDPDDELMKPDEPQTSSTSISLPKKAKRGRPRKNPDVKIEKKAKLKAKESKARTSKSVSRGDTTEAESKSSMSAIKRNRLMKINAIYILESSTVVPFKWHRQNYLCFFCHHTFKSTDHLKDHTREKHKKSNIKAAVSYLRRDEKVKIDVSEIVCLICEMIFKDLNELISHIKIIHQKPIIEQFGYGLVPYKLQEDVFQCAICEDTFQYFNKLNQHMNEHYGNYVCEWCGKSFLTNDRLRNHALSHTSGFHCSYCTESFDSLTRRVNHELAVHNKEKSLKCHFCQETFQNYNLRKKHHKLVHNLETPEYNCPVCGKTFGILSKMNVHLNAVHKRQMNFSCAICSHQFFSRAQVEKHMVRHNGERVHQCDVCKKSYARKQTLRDHMRIHNNDKRFACTVCDQAFVQNVSLKLHLKVHHVKKIKI